MVRFAAPWSGDGEIVINLQLTAGQVDYTGNGEIDCVPRRGIDNRLAQRAGATVVQICDSAGRRSSWMRCQKERAIPLKEPNSVLGFITLLPLYGGKAVPDFSFTVDTSELLMTPLTLTSSRKLEASIV